MALIDDPDEEQRWGYGELKDASDRLSAALRARGLHWGGRIAVMLPLFTLFGPEALAPLRLPGIFPD